MIHVLLSAGTDAIDAGRLNLCWSGSLAAHVQLRGSAVSANQLCPSYACKLDFEEPLTETRR